MFWVNKRVLFSKWPCDDVGSIVIIIFFSYIALDNATYN